MVSGRLPGDGIVYVNKERLVIVTICIAVCADRNCAFAARVIDLYYTVFFRVGRLNDFFTVATDYTHECE